MSLMRRALEDETSDTTEQTVVMSGPLSDVYAQALDIAYAKDAVVDPAATPAEGGTPPAEPVAVEKPAMEAASNSKKKKKLKIKIKKGGFHEWLGKKPGEPITDADIKKGLESKDPHVRKMAIFAKNAKKWHDKKKKSGKVATEAIFDLPAMESIEGEYIAALETQQMDAALMAKLSEAVIDQNAAPTDNFQTVYGVSKDDVTEDTVVDVAAELVNSPEATDFVLVVDACSPGENGDVGTPDEKMVQLTGALECMVECHGGKVVHSLEEAVEYLVANKK